MEDFKLSIIVSAYNEELCLTEFYSVLSKELIKCHNNYEIIFVNDGSKDKTEEILESIKTKDKNVTIIEFSRNFGHEAAMLAGLDNSNGDLMIFMDADLQHPPRVIPNIIEKYNSGANIITMVRLKNEDTTFMHTYLSGSFYKILSIVSGQHFDENASDFFAIDRRVCEVLKSNYREKIRFLRGFIQCVGFNKVSVEYAADKRLAGKTHYNPVKLFNFATDTIYSFSRLPLHLAKVFSFVSAVFGLVLLIYTLLTMEGAPSGYATIVIFLSFMFAMLFLVLSIMGDYISIIFDEMKERPIYIIKAIK